MTSVRETVAVCLFLGAALVIVMHCAGCHLFRDASPAAAEAAYGGQLLECIDKSSTLAESKACRAEVDRQWGITQTVADGGQ